MSPAYGSTAMASISAAIATASCRGNLLRAFLALGSTSICQFSFDIVPRNHLSLSKTLFRRAKHFYLTSGWRKFTGCKRETLVLCDSRKVQLDAARYVEPHSLEDFFCACLGFLVNPYLNRGHTTSVAHRPFVSIHCHYKRFPGDKGTCRVKGVYTSDTSAR